MDMKKRFPSWLEPLFFILILGTALLITSRFHQGKGYFNWKSEIWSDKAGYYIYLPATLYYHWDLKACPQKMDERTGYGFVYEQSKGKIKTDFTYGVAFLLSPFFVATHSITKIAGIPQDWAFAPVYHKMADVASVFYLALGLFLLFRFLRKYFSERSSYITVLILFAGTGLFYYSVIDTLMSHVYSFFLVSLFLLFLKKFLDDTSKRLYLLVFILTFAFAVLIRPSALMLVFVLLFLDVSSRAAFIERLKLIFKPGNIGLLVLVNLIVWLPQMAYNHYLTGDFIVLPSQPEMFPNLFSPRLPELWFSTLNGLFMYTPLMILVVAGIVMMVRRKETNGLMSMFIFLLMSYIFASWWCWYFGCAFGQRSFTDFLPLLGIPLAYLVEQCNFSANKMRAVVIAILILFFCWFNVRVSYAYEGCFFGSAWDWNQYGKLLNSSGLWPVKPGFSHHNDYENLSIANGGTTTSLVSRSRDHSLLFDKDHEFNSSFFEYPDKMKQSGPLKKLKVNFYIFRTGGSATGAFLVCDIKKDGKQILYESRPLDVPMARTREWYVVPANFDMPANLDPWAEVRIYIWNKSKTTFYVDDFDINTE